ncbi:MAG: HTH domain-containing protein [Nanoarchaeota archaeon]|mgnify:CR=1 FL=1
MGFWFFGRKKDAEINNLKNNLRGSFSNIKGDISLINEVLNHFRERHSNYDKKFEHLERDIAEIRHLLEKKDKIATRRSSFERSIVHERSRAFKRSNQSFMNVQSLKKLKEYLTPAQKRVIQMLNLAEIPLEYEDLAKELKLSVITVRRHINDIKKMGFQIKEKMNIDTGRKVFFIENVVKRAIRGKK